MIHSINYFITTLFNWILYPFSFIGEFWGILFLSVAMSFAILLIYKYISSPVAIRTAKDRIKGNILGMRIYKDSGLIIISSFFKSLFYIAKYLGLNLVPLLVVVPLLFPVFVQMDVRYGMLPFQTGEKFVVKSAFNHDIDNLDIQLLPNPNFKPAMNPVFIRALKETNWKLIALKPGTTQIRVKVGGTVYEKTLVIGRSRAVLCNNKMKVSSWEHFIEPAETLLPSTGEMERITLHYPGRDVTFAGITAPWWLFNLILVVVIVLAFKRRFGVEF